MHRRSLLYVEVRIWIQLLILFKEQIQDCNFRIFCIIIITFPKTYFENMTFYNTILYSLNKIQLLYVSPLITHKVDSHTFFLEGGSTDLDRFPLLAVAFHATFPSTLEDSLIFRRRFLGVYRASYIMEKAGKFCSIGSETCTIILSMPT